MKKSRMIREIPLNEIIIGDNYRKPDNIEQIAISINSQGQLNPVLVLKKGEGYLIIDGNRRYQGILYANEKLGAKIQTVEAILVDEKLEDDERSLLQMVLNETLDSPVERAAKIVELAEKGMAVKKIAEAFGVDDTYIYSLKKKFVPDEIFRAYINNRIILRVADKENEGRIYYATNLKAFESLFAQRPELMKTLSKVSPGEERIKLFAMNVLADTYYKLNEINRLDLFHELIVTLQHRKIYDRKQIEGYCKRTLEKVESGLKEKKKKKDSNEVHHFSSKISELFKTVGEINPELIEKINDGFTKNGIPVVITLRK